MSATVATRIIGRWPGARSTGRAPVERLILAHGTASVAMALPWPALCVITWSSTHSDVWLGVAGAARMAPYVALSWLAGALGDRVPRIRLLRASTWVRAALLMAAALLVEMGHGLAAVVATTLVVAVGTPAYPALVAEMPQLAGSRTERATRWLVTFEISAFVVGSAFGGLAIGLLGVNGSIWLAAGLGLAACLMLVGTRIDRERSAALVKPSRGRTGLVIRSGSAGRAIAAVAVINAVGGAVAVALLPMAQRAWAGGTAEFGLATAAVGFGALGAPVLLRFVPNARRVLLLCCLPLAGVAATPTAHWAVVPLAVLGASGTGFECQMTAVIQRSVPDVARAFALGLADTAMMSAALVGTSLAPLLASQLGPRGLFLLCAAAVTAVIGLRVRAERD
jgi:MFS family permease